MHLSAGEGCYRAGCVLYSVFDTISSMKPDKPRSDPQIEETVRQKLNRETAKIGWSELARLFATGVVIVVKDGLDLVGVAESFVDDDSQRISSLMDDKKIWKASDQDAVKWNDASAEVWAVVVSPWVLVQGTKS